MDQVKLLKRLAKRLKSKRQTKRGATQTLRGAKILDKHGNFTRHFRNLGR